MSPALVGFIMIGVIAFILIRGNVSISPVFVIIPIIGAAVLGYGISEIEGFVFSGLGSVYRVAALFAFAVMYFSFLNDVGMFDILVKKIMGLMSNRIEIVLLLTVGIGAITHLDGSGATSMLITIPAMLPIYKKMNIRPQALLLMAALATGSMNVTPWCSSILRLTSAVPMGPQELWLYVLPLQIFALVVTGATAIFIAKVERKNGAGMSDEQFSELKRKLEKPAETHVSAKVIVFDMLLTVLLIALLLTGVLSVNVGFMIAFAIALVVNYPNVKEQRDKIREYGGRALRMICIIFSIGVLVGVMNEAGMIESMAHTIVSVLPKSMGTHLSFIVSLFSVPLSMIVGSDTVYLVIAPLLSNIVTAYGGSIAALSAALLMGAAISANLCLVAPTPYLALGLSDVTMSSHLRYSFKYVWVVGILISLFAGILGIIPF